MGAKTWLLLKKLRFLQLTLYIIFFLFASPFFGHDWILRLFSSIFLLNALLVSISASGKTVHMKWLLWVLFGAAVIFSALFLSPLVPTKHLMLLKLAIGCEVLVLLVCLGAILAFIFATTQVTLDTIFAAVVAYLFIAFSFAQGVYALTFVFTPEFQLPCFGPTGCP